ncbi:hypothetical protein PIB30_105341, partial [Stylosanthes scabra]|nr:hypothetical protein [Stylosanthes scabra]
MSTTLSTPVIHNFDSPANASNGINSDDSRQSAPVATSGFKKERVSFRDKLVGGSTSNSSELGAGLEGELLGTVRGKQGDPIPPSVTFTDETVNVFSKPFQEAIVIK